MTSQAGQEFFRELYREFEMPLSELDCGLKCGPYNDYGVPVCCDIGLVIPSAFEEEWGYLQESTDLWEPWSSSGLYDHQLEEEAQDGQVLLQCRGYRDCQRPVRTLTCRAFPFYPYLDSQGGFRGLGYYADFRDNCWIISNLGVVTLEYKAAFRSAFERVFEHFPESRAAFLDFCGSVRDAAAREGEGVVLLDFSGEVWVIDPVSEELTPVDYQDLEAFGPFAVAQELRFPDEIEADEE
jgi:hypothetical protein